MVLVPPPSVHAGAWHSKSTPPTDPVSSESSDGCSPPPPPLSAGSVAPEFECVTWEEQRIPPKEFIIAKQPPGGADSREAGTERQPEFKAVCK
ncbi:hypothetical protein AAFF_G00264020 [Aldrovandia affinis]|uniref:Uncharacterized protein n=1 Tax=Aldrovandia affinis TaxID=143900 RepID=A0AAD7SSR0_9TELE|nr:hypothetical protein AAFF_G00264020 [Aldrovandia affinis]